ncbi:MAG: PAS domain-containing sensor histidine kinase [Candidatus Omnitrophota bacterium]
MEGKRRKLSDIYKGEGLNLKDLLSSIPGAVYQYDCYDRCAMHFISEGIKDISGYTAEDLMHGGGRSYASIIHPDDRERVDKFICNCVRKKTPYSIEYRIICADGRKKWVFEKGSGIFDEEGAMEHLDGIIFDITQQQEIWKMQRFSEMAKIIADIAHELNNPIMVIMGRARLSLMEDIQDEQVKSNLETIEGQSEKAKQIIRSVLRFFKPVRLCCEESDIAEILDEAVSGVEELREGGGIEVRKNYGAPCEHVRIDRKHMIEALKALLVNAAEAIRERGEGGVVEITAAADKEAVNVEIKDTGCGIKKEDQEKIFVPFFSMKEERLGMGLSVASKVVEAHEGKLSCKSVPGEKTVFTVSLPRETPCRKKQEEGGTDKQGTCKRA